MPLSWIVAITSVAMNWKKQKTSGLIEIFMLFHDENSTEAATRDVLRRRCSENM